ncbi:MAG: DUF1844 domain-containing protein [Gemmatimonadota bacterium]|nr:DUF1844 domain-containing protein [Gemmatimonadota bacterium]
MEENSPGAMEPEFNTLVMMLSGSAMGYIEAADEKEDKKHREENLEMAGFVIDLMAVLKDKTAGNLNDEEKNVLERVLSELRVHYVKTKG